ncbi:hypothetical protein [Psychrobacter sp. NG27]|uniref:hypothetical protein n=2 Tax=Psychrobacter TaxID=497 RepID=UPI0018E00614|nr:hypothetical protein [Psychrobacter sp. NG27]MBI0427166.1 hypothetical protein [Psychrobacter sp. NG27]
MIKYLSIDEAISITEHNIKGSMFETLGAKQFLDRFINKGQLKPVYYFDGFAILRHSAPLDFEHELIRNIWLIEGYFKDDHSLFIENAKIFRQSRAIRDSAFKGLSNSIFKLNQNTGYIHEIVASRYVGDDETHEIVEKTNLENGWSYEKSHAILFNKKPSYERTYAYEKIEETILIDRDNVFFDIQDINNILKQLPVGKGQHINTPIISTTPYQENDQDNQRIADLQRQIAGFESQVAQAKTELENTSVDDEPTHHKTINSMATLVATLLKLASYDKQDLENPHGNINKEIIAKAEGLGLTLGKDFIAKWLKKADEVL